MINRISESAVVEATLTWFGELGYTCLYGPDIAPGEAAADLIKVLAGLRYGITRVVLR